MSEENQVVRPETAGTRLLIQFAKTPVPGQVKTRLHRVYSPEQACEFHCQLVQQTAETLLQSRADNCQLCVAGDLAHELWQSLQGEGFHLALQSTGDLGDRMLRAINQGLDHYESVVLVGSDCPALTPQVLARAFNRLEQGADLVLNPAEDGGYVLIGAAKALPEALFKGVAWGTERVLAQTCVNAEKQGMKVALLPELWDVDHPEDVRRWQQGL